MITDEIHGYDGWKLQAPQEEMTDEEYEQWQRDQEDRGDRDYDASRYEE